MTETRLQRSEFSGWWHEINREFPPYKVPADLLAAQAERWFRELSEFTIHALNDALSHWLRTQDRRPKLAHMRDGCLQYLMRITAAMNVRAKIELEPVDSNHCPCRCGGARWTSVLLGAAGTPRTDRIVGADGALYDATRDHIECLVNGVDLIPRIGGELLGRDDRGIPVWLMRASAIEEAA